MGQAAVSISRLEKGMGPLRLSNEFFNKLLGPNPNVRRSVNLAKRPPIQWAFRSLANCPRDT